MKKLSLVLIAIITFTHASAQEKWFVSGGLDFTVASVDGTSASSFGIGAGIHRMLGDKFSAGINLSYAGADDLNGYGIGIEFSYYGKLVDRLYYVPEVSFERAYYPEAEVGAIGVGISPFGLEFRPLDKLSFRVNILNFTFIDMQGIGISNFGISPTLSVNFHF